MVSLTGIPMPTAVEVRTPARLHLGLLSFGDPTLRAYGGLGVMIDAPGVVVRLRRHSELSGAGPLGTRALAFARECVRAWGLGPEATCAIEVVAAPRAHVGLGSGTQLALAVAAGMRQLFCPWPHEQSASALVLPVVGQRHFDTAEAISLARGVGRGRRSSVGIHGFSGGGLIVEAGKYAPPPSAASEVEAGGGSHEVSPLVARVHLPAEWRCVVIIQRDAEGLHGEAEKAAFADLPPVERALSAELARIALMELVPAALEGKFAEFSAAVGRYGQLAGLPFASHTAGLPQTESTRQLLELLAELGFCGSAQSSWGPAVMACCPSAQAAEQLVETFQTRGLSQRHDLWITRFDNRGAMLNTLE